MLNKATAILKQHKDLFIYLILGVATTIINFAAYYPLLNVLKLSATISNITAWTISVLFAFLTNKPFAFKSKNWSLNVLAPEFLKFVSCRIGSGILETAFLALTVDFLHWNGNVMKLLISVVVVAVNYVASKYFVFRK